MFYSKRYDAERTKNVTGISHMLLSIKILKGTNILKGNYIFEL